MAVKNVLTERFAEAIDNKATMRLVSTGGNRD
jgi:hypothetical protein